MAPLDFDLLAVNHGADPDAPSIVFAEGEVSPFHRRSSTATTSSRFPMTIFPAQLGKLNPPPELGAIPFPRGKYGGRWRRTTARLTALPRSRISSRVDRPGPRKFTLLSTPRVGNPAQSPSAPRCITAEWIAASCPARLLPVPSWLTEAPEGRWMPQTLTKARPTGRPKWVDRRRQANSSPRPPPNSFRCCLHHPRSQVADGWASI